MERNHSRIYRVQVALLAAALEPPGDVTSADGLNPRSRQDGLSESGSQKSKLRQTKEGDWTHAAAQSSTNRASSWGADALWGTCPDL